METNKVNVQTPHVQIPQVEASPSSYKRKDLNPFETPTTKRKNIRSLELEERHYWWTTSHIYLFGGFIANKYDDTKENLYETHSPYQSRGKLLPLSSALFHINMKEKTIEKIYAHQEYASACPTMHITDFDQDGKAERIFIIGETTKQNIIYSKNDFELKQCEIPHEYGCCRLEKMTPNTVTNTCSMCHKKIHSDCDSYKHMKKKPSYTCPKCKNIEFLSQRPKVKRGCLNK